MNGSVVDTVLEVSYFSGLVLFPNLLLRLFVALLARLASDKVEENFNALNT